MTAIVTTPGRDLGRGAWRGVGGTLDDAGKLPGRYYVNAATGVALVGQVGFDADRASSSVDLNFYAVYRGVVAIQERLGIAADGLFGPMSKSAVAAFQKANGLFADGIYGPASARVMWRPDVQSAVVAQDSLRASDLLRMCLGTISIESGWDQGAVGRSTPDDVGIMQISRKNHPDMSTDMCLTPKLAIPYGVRLIDNNLRAMNWNVRDGVAAYNLGVQGARDWVAAGRPDYFPRLVNGVTVQVNVKGYIDKILAAGA